MSYLDEINNAVKNRITDEELDAKKQLTYDCVLKEIAYCYSQRILGSIKTILCKSPKLSIVNGYYRMGSFSSSYDSTYQKKFKEHILFNQTVDDDNRDDLLNHGENDGHYSFGYVSIKIRQSYVANKYPGIKFAREYSVILGSLKWGLTPKLAITDDCSKILKYVEKIFKDEKMNVTCTPSLHKSVETDIYGYKEKYYELICNWSYTVTR